jgi:hypothetical protein
MGLGRGIDSGILREADKIRDRSHPKLLHHAPPMNFDCLLRRLQFSGNLLIQKTQDDKPHHFKLAWSQRVETSARFASFRAFTPTFFSAH